MAVVVLVEGMAFEDGPSTRQKTNAQSRIQIILDDRVGEMCFTQIKAGIVFDQIDENQFDSFDQIDKEKGQNDVEVDFPVSSDEKDKTNVF